MKLAGIGRVLLVAMAVFVAVWLCVIVYWRASDATPGATQMLLLLGVLPLALLSSIWLVRRIRASRARKDEAAAATATTSEAESAEPFEPAPPLACLSGAVRLPCGDDPAQVLALLAAPPRPGLHPHFRDRDGLPVFVAHVDGLEVEEFADSANFAQQARAALAEVERVRALALLETVASQLFDQAALWLPPLQVARESVVAGLRRTQADEVRVALRVHALLPMRWEAPLRQAAADWLLDLALACGLDRRRIALDVVPADGATTTWGLLDAIAGGSGDDGAWHLVLAADSLVGERSVQRLVATGRLMDSRTSDGIVPGEGAAGILLRPPGAPDVPDSDDATPALHRASRTTLAIGAVPRAAARTSGELMTLALQRAAIEPDAITQVLSDADQRPARAVEASAAATTACPELDIASQGGAIGVPCGETGHVAPVALLALAVAQVRQSRQAVLLLSLGAGQERLAAVMAPLEQAPTAEQAGAEPDADT